MLCTFNAIVLQSFNTFMQYMCRFLSLIALSAFIIYCFSFADTKGNYSIQTADYYDAQLDTLLIKVKNFEKAAKVNTAKPELIRHFFACRNQYKRISFFVEQFDTRGARSVNGPDLLRIEDDTQQDSTKPHGFQHIEAILYAAQLDRSELKKELAIQYDNINALRNAPDHRYYFRHSRIWEATRAGLYRIISLGITGFDVPLSLHAIPETKEQLLAIRKIVTIYEGDIEARLPDLYPRAVRQCDSAIAYVSRPADFNTFNRIVFIRQYLNPLSATLRDIAYTLGEVNDKQLTPLNPKSDNLFSADIFNITFFSPNERYHVTPARVTLGKKLFYDTRLSGNNSRSCATCHKPELAFTDGLPKGKHINGKQNVLRNTPTLWNSAYQVRQFYDSRALVLETQLSAVVHNTQEMGGSLQDAIPVLAADAEYAAMFSSAYANDKDKISQYTIANAISSYIRTLTGLNSPFDKYIRSESETLSAAAQNGFNLFMGKAKCGTCHYAPAFNGLVPPRYEETESEILAVPATNTAKAKLDADEGKFGFTKVPLHKYAFKTPTVRNAAITAPYMHNGVFPTLNDVLQFYNKGGGAGVGIHLENQTLPAEKLGLTAKEIKDIEAFLRSLTDTTYTYSTAVK